MTRLLLFALLLPALAVGQMKNNTDEMTLSGKPYGGATWTASTTVYSNVYQLFGDSVRIAVAFPDSVNVTVSVQEGFSSGTKFVSYKETVVDSIQSGSATPTVAAPYYKELQLTGKLSTAAVTYRLKFVFAATANHAVASKIAARKFLMYMKEYGLH